HAERRVVMLVQHDAVEAGLLREPIVLEILVVEPAAGNRVEVAVGKHESGGAELSAFIRRIRRHRLLGEVHEMHRLSLLPAGQALFANATTSRVSSSGFSMSTAWPTPSSTSSRARASAFT